MTQPTGPVLLGVYEAWLQACAEIVRMQWAMFNRQYQFGLRALSALMAPPPAAGPPAACPPASPEGAEEGIEARARERMRRGLAPPRDIYEAQNRGQIDWTELPDWARPSDPEMFEGAHEG